MYCVKFYVIIYQILNKINGKSYIGQSINSFERRYDCGKWWIYSSSRLLQNAYRKYGKNSFEVIILEEINSEEELDKKEIEYIEKYNTVSPNGYNLLRGGDGRKHHSDTADKISKSRRRNKKYRFKSPDGEIFEFFNLAKFCREQNLSDSMMNFVSTGRYKKHKGWTLPETNLSEISILSPEGDIIKIKEGKLREFCRENNLHHQGIIKLMKKEYSQHKGWKRDE